MQILSDAEKQRLYKLSEKGRITQSKWYKSDAKKIESAKYRKNNREKIKAHNTLNNAIRAGKMVRKPCAECGAKGYAHHDDYSKPLIVKWICNKHHPKLHQKMIGGGNNDK